MPKSQAHITKYGPRPTDAEVREARAAGLQNPRWKRQNRIAKDRMEESVGEAAAYAAQLATSRAQREFTPTEDSHEANHVDGLDRDNLGDSID